MTIPYQDNWEEKFDKEFMTTSESGELKDFIRSLLEKEGETAYEEGYDKGWKSVYDSPLSTYKSELRKKLEGMRSDIPAKSDMVSVNKEDGYNLALSDAINLLDN